MLHLALLPLFLSLFSVAEPAQAGRAPGASQHVPASLETGIRAALSGTRYEAVWQVGTPLEGVPAAWQAPNRARGLRTFFTATGARVTPFAGEGWHWGLEPVRVGRAGAFRDVAVPELSVTASCAEYRRGELVEWYANGPLGLEQGFTLERAPEGGAPGEPLELVLAVRGELRAQATPGDRDIVFRNACGDRVLDYRELVAWDAAGRELRAWFELSPGLVLVRVDDRDAVYPVTIDPMVFGFEQTLLAGDGAGGDAFGTSVSLTSDRALVGAYLDDDNGSDSGSAYVFVRSGTTWTQEAKLLASDGASSDRFGWAVSLTADRALVGAYWDDAPGSNSGSAYVFVRSGTTWTQEDKITAADAAANDNFGYSVSLTADRALIGSLGDDDLGLNSGSAYVFLRSGSTWAQEAKLLAADGFDQDNFGRAVSLTSDRALIGSPADDDSGSSSGSVYIFLRSGTAWAQETKIIASGGKSSDRFGDAVSLTADRALVGAPYDDNPSPMFAVDGGSAFVYLRSGTTWSHETKLLAPDPTTADYFGISVSLTDDRALIGVYLDDDDGTDSGSAHLFERSGATWSHAAKLLAQSGSGGDEYGTSVSLIQDAALVGAPGDDDLGSDSGSAHVLFPPPPPSTYCTGKTNACGVGVISSTGASSASSSSGFVVMGAPPVGGKVGVLLYNEGAGPAPPYLPFGGSGGGGRLCIQISLMKHARGAASGGVDGACGNGAQFAVDMNAYSAGALGGFPAPYLSTPGATVHCQWWGRESPGSSFLTDGMEYMVGP